MVGERDDFSAELQAVVGRVRSRRLEDRSRLVDRGPERGDVYLAQETWGGEHSRRRHVLVLRIDAGEELAEVVLLGHYPEYATDRDLVLEPHQTDLPYPLVAYCDLRAPIWTIQLGERQGSVTGDVFDLLPRVSRGAAPDSVIRQVGLPLQGEDDPRRHHKYQEFCDLHRIAGDRIAASLEGRGIFGGIVGVGADVLVTVRRVLPEGTTPSDLDIMPESVVVLDPAILTTPVGDALEAGIEARQLARFLARHSRVRLPASIVEDGERLKHLIKRQYGQVGQQHLLNALVRRGGLRPPTSPGVGEGSEADAPEYVLIGQAA